MPNQHAALADYPVVIEAPIHWGDQDAFGHVNNIMYLRWAETSRVEYLMRIGGWQRFETERVGPILAHISCDYRRALTFPDTVLIGARITAVGNSSMKMAHRVVSVSGNDVSAELNSVLVWLDYATNRPIPVPADLRQAIDEFEAAVRQEARSQESGARSKEQGAGRQHLGIG